MLVAARLFEVRETQMGILKNYDKKTEETWIFVHNKAELMSMGQKNCKFCPTQKGGT